MVIAAEHKAQRLAAMDDEVTSEFERLARQVYSGKLSVGNLDAELQRFVAESLFKGVEKGFKTGVKGPDYSTPDKVMLAKLEQNTWWFSHAKTHAELMELNAALIDDDGRLRQFGDFKAEALRIHERYNVTQFRPEYGFAVASSQMAARWMYIQEAKDTHPFLKYQTAGDGHVRPEHAALDGVIKPVDDAFWDRWYPPNDWGCRCDVVQVANGKETPDSHISLPPTNAKKEIFEYNPGKAGVVYPPDHPYYELLNSIANRQRRHQIAQMAWDNYAKHSHRYVKDKTGVWVHPLADAKDLPANLKVAKLLSQKGFEVRIRPDARAFKIDGVTNAEYEIGGKLADLKEPVSAKRSGVAHRIASAGTQRCEIAVILLHNPELTLQELTLGIRNAFLEDKRAASVQKLLLVYRDNSIIEIERSEAARGNWAFSKKLKAP